MIGPHLRCHLGGPFRRPGLRKEEEVQLSWFLVLSNYVVQIRREENTTTTTKTADIPNNNNTSSKFCKFLL